jgi:hypothetical protein
MCVNLKHAPRSLTAALCCFSIFGISFNFFSIDSNRSMRFLSDILPLNGLKCGSRTGDRPCKRQSRIARGSERPATNRIRTSPAPLLFESPLHPTLDRLQSMPLCAAPRSAEHSALADAICHLEPINSTSHPTSLLRTTPIHLCWPRHSQHGFKWYSQR